MDVLVRFAGFGPEEDEWVNVPRHVRQRSLPCEASECVAVLPGDLILCFQEGKEQALYFDAHVLDAQRRRHDVRGCSCRFLVRYDHDQSEVGRYKSPDEHPFFPTNLPEPMLPPLLYPQVLHPCASSININSLIWNMYFRDLLPRLVKPGDDGNSGSTAVCDTICLQITV